MLGFKNATAVGLIVATVNVLFTLVALKASFFIMVQGRQLTSFPLIRLSTLWDDEELCFSPFLL